MDDMKFQLEMMNALNQQLNGKEKMYQLVCSTSRNAFIYFDLVKRNISVLGNWDRFFDFSITMEGDLIKLVSMVDEAYKSDLQKLLYLELDGLTNMSLECSCSDSNKWLEFETTVIYQNHKPYEKVIRIKDITKEKKQNEEFRYMAYYDALTGLYNRNHFVRDLSEWIREEQKEKETIAVMCLDIDHFKKINDGLGLIAGDELVQNFGLFLSEFVDEQTIVAHVTDDTFYIAIKNPVGKHSVENVYKLIQERLKEPFKLMGGHEIYITLGVGVAEYPDAATDCLELINCSEVVMFRAKEHGPNTLEFFQRPILEEFIENVNLENRLKEAVNMNHFVLFYQPQYDSHTRKLRGVEALIRWKDENNKMISPGVFIPVAEKNGMIVPIGDWVLEEGIKQYADWRENYNTHIVLSLNISPLQYRRPDFVPNLISLLEEYKVDPKDIELEITESVLIDDFDQVVEKLHVLKDYGIKISLDDFGTGFSSLSYLKGLPIDTLKIDKSFIDTIIQDESTQVITESIVSMVKKLGYETVAEGVETQEQFEYLRNIECDNIQGYLLGRPMPSDKLGELLAAMG